MVVLKELELKEYWLLDWFVIWAPLSPCWITVAAPTPGVPWVFLSGKNDAFEDMAFPEKRLRLAATAGQAKGSSRTEAAEE